MKIIKDKKDKKNQRLKIKNLFSVFVRCVTSILK